MTPKNARNHALIKLAQSGDRAALNAAIKSNSSLAYRFGGWKNDGAMADAMLALWRSIMAFDGERGFQFSTFASRAIVRAVSRRKKHADREAVEAPIDLDGVEYDLQSKPQAETLNQETIEKIHAAMEELPKRWPQILMLRVGGMALSEVGAIFGYSKERVRQIQEAAMARLRKALAKIVVEDCPWILEKRYPKIAKREKLWPAKKKTPCKSMI